jgi:ribose 5-phosphate isomerase B
VAADRAAGLDSLGVVVGGSGNGEQMAANKVPGIRAALVWSEQTAALAREHNDAQVVSVGGRMHSIEEMTRYVEVFLTTPFSGDERHVRRIAMMGEYESSHELPPLPESARRQQGRDA